MGIIKILKCSFPEESCKFCKILYCSDKKYKIPEVNVETYKAINMEQKELTAQEIIEKLIDEQKINGKEAIILLNAINKPAEIRIEKEHTPYTLRTTPWYQTLDTREPKCYEIDGTCTNPHKDCINCPKIYNRDSSMIYTTRDTLNPLTPTTKEE